MRIEAPNLDDILEITDLWVALAESQREFRSHLLSDANRETIADEIARQTVTNGVLVARDDAGIVGFVTFSPETGVYYQDSTRGIVHNLYVHPESRNQGVGSALLAAAEARLADAGVDVISLEAMAANEDARRFYRRRGYVVHRIEFEKSAENDTHSKE